MRNSLEVAIPSGLNRVANIELLNIHLASSDSPFAVVDYAVDGEKQELGLRLDLDKQVFLDKTGDPRIDDVLQNRAAEIVTLVAALKLEMHRGTFEQSVKSYFDNAMRQLDLWSASEQHVSAIARTAWFSTESTEKFRSALMKAIEESSPDLNVENLRAALASTESTEKNRSGLMKAFEEALQESYRENLRAALASPESAEKIRTAFMQFTPEIYLKILREAAHFINVTGEALSDKLKSESQSQEKPGEEEPIGNKGR